MADIETNYPNGVQLGELANIGGGNLRCQELYLGYLPNWSDTKGKVSLLKLKTDEFYQYHVLQATCIFKDLPF